MHCVVPYFLLWVRAVHLIRFVATHLLKPLVFQHRFAFKLYGCINYQIKFLDLSKIIFKRDELIHQRGELY
jgi:hypothetical protein